MYNLNSVNVIVFNCTCIYAQYYTRVIYKSKVQLEYKVIGKEFFYMI